MGKAGLGLVESVHFNKGLRYLMLVLREGATQDDLLGIAPDFPAMLGAQTNDEVFAVMVTAAAGAGPCARPVVHAVPLSVVRSPR